MNLSKDHLWEAWGRTNALYTAWCAAGGQNQYRLFVLYALYAHEPVTQKEIADSTGLSKQTVSTVMRALKAEGLVVLRADGTDRREKSVHLTQKGKDYAAEILSPLHKLEQRVFDIMGADRVKQMTDAIALFNLVFEKEMESLVNE
jgi:DNA-binding MarR family transcriptional regulator